MLIRPAGTVCPMCGAEHAACGPSRPVNPVDIPEVRSQAMGPVRKYRLIHNGHETVMRLNAADVKLYPDAELVEDNSDSEPADTTASGKSRTAANKARRPSGDKSSGA